MTFTAPSPQKLALLRRRSRAIAAVRSYFTSRGLLEVDTAVTLIGPAPEPYIDAVPVTFRVGKAKLARYLQTSPELAMKQLVAGGLGPIFQIAACFRDDDMTDWHRPEFRLLEWYRPESDYKTLMDDAEQLLRHVAEQVGDGCACEVSGRRIELTLGTVRKTISEVFVETANFTPLDYPCVASFAQKMKASGIHTSESDSWEDLFHRAFFAHVEPFLKASSVPVFLYEFPCQLAALARICPHDERVAERVELYVGGIELANGFGELTCPKEQRRRFELDNAKRGKLGRTSYPLDESFLSSLAHLGDTAGMALGIDRLMMLLFGARNLDEVSFLPW